jgi:3-oxoadipate enol-lactonase
VVHISADYLPLDGGGRLFREIAGAGPTLVLTHDALLHRESWDAQFTSFARHYRVVRWDRRGYGRSDQAQQAYSSVDDLTRVVRSVSDTPAILVGCSYGSLLSVHCALEHPDLVAALVLVGPIVGGLGFTEHFLTRGGYHPPAPDAPVEQQIAYWSRTDPWFTAAASTAARERLRALLGDNPHNLLAPSNMQQSPQPPALAHLPRLSMPTLIVVGEHDIPDVHAHSGALAAGIPGAGRVVLAASGHLPHLEAPDAFNQTVLGFLDPKHS